MSFKLTNIVASDVAPFPVKADEETPARGGNGAVEGGFVVGGAQSSWAVILLQR